MTRVFKWIFAVLIAVTGVLWAAYFLLRPSDQSPSQNTFVVGVLAPTTGRNAQYGKWIVQGLELARDDLNASGGLNKRQIALDIQNDEADPAKATLGFKYLASVTKVPAIYGPWASSAVLAIAPLANQEHVVVLASAISPKIRDAGDFVFRMQPDAHYYLQTLVPYVRTKMHLQRVGILYVNNDFGIDQATVFKKLFTDAGGTVARSEGYRSNATDFRAELTALRAANVQGVFLASYAEMATILKQAPEVGLNNVRFIGSVPTENPDIVAGAGPAAEGVVYPSHFDAYSSDPRVVEFQKRYEKRFGEAAEGFAALAYDGLYALVSAARSRGASGDDIKAGLYGMKPMPGITGPTSFDDHGDVVKPIVIKTIRNGKFVKVTDQ